MSAKRSDPLQLAEVVLLALAAHRGTVAWLDDSISEGLRLKFLNWCLSGGPARQRLADLTDCPHCAGAHVSWVTYAAYALARRRRASVLEHAVAVWAVAGGQILLNALGAGRPPAEQE